MWFKVFYDQSDTSRFKSFFVQIDQNSVELLHNFINSSNTLETFYGNSRARFVDELDNSIYINKIKRL